MSLPSPAGLSVEVTGPWRRRLIGRWWRRQSPAQQDRLATFGPLASVLLFLAAIVAAFWYLRNEEIERATESVHRDTEIAQQQVRMRLIGNQEELVRLTREQAWRDPDTREFGSQAQAFAVTRPEVVQMSLLGSARQLRARYQTADREEPPIAGAAAEAAPRPAEAAGA